MAKGELVTPPCPSGAGGMDGGRGEGGRPARGEGVLRKGKQTENRTHFSFSLISNFFFNGTAYTLRN